LIQLGLAQLFELSLGIRSK